MSRTVGSIQSSPNEPVSFVRKTDRVRAYRAARRHSIFVRVLKFTLPVLAVGCVGLFVLAMQPSLTIGETTIVIDNTEITPESLRMINPRLEGTTEDKGRYVVAAKTATQKLGNLNVFRLDEIDARLTQADGNWAKLVARTGRFARDTEQLDLVDDIVVTTSSGMRARLRVAAIDVPAQHVVSLEPVRVDMLNGHINADRMDMRVNTREITFTGNVKVRLRKVVPKAEAGEGGK